MDVVNATPYEIAYTAGLAPDGRESVVVVVKGTFVIPERGGPLELADEQLELVHSDTFTGKPGLSAMEYESEFAPHKGMCDVLLLGSAHAPGGRPATSVPVALQVGSMVKQFEVVGDRYWTVWVSSPRPSSPEPFVNKPISYDRAYGGSTPVAAYPDNPVGVGYHPKASDADVFGKPVPNTQEFDNPVDSPRGNYKPMAFGPIGRNFSARLAHAGTYDAAWLEHGFPFLPADFDLRYYQAAPVDQRIPHPRGGEAIQLVNLTPQPRPAFTLPPAELTIEFTNAAIQRTTTQAKLDTILIEPDHDRVQLLWRSALPLRRNLREMRQVVVGRMPAGWYRARELGKRYYPSLRHLVAARKAERDGD
jgi:hypothetical protein